MHLLVNKICVNLVACFFVITIYLYLFYIASLAIMGFPFLTGFFSKELIIEFGTHRFIIDTSFCYIITILSAFFTVLYSFKLLYILL